MDTAKDFVRTGLQSARITRKLNAKGIEFTYQTRRDYYNLKFRAGRLHDGMVKTTNRWEVSGKTYPVRNTLKQYSFRWDPKNKVWYRLGDVDFNAVGGALVRALNS